MGGAGTDSDGGIGVVESVVSLCTNEAIPRLPGARFLPMFPGRMCCSRKSLVNFELLFDEMGLV